MKPEDTLLCFLKEAIEQLDVAYPEHIQSLVKGSPMWDSIWRAKQLVQSALDVIDQMDDDEWLEKVTKLSKEYYGDEEE
tara:strand:- start:333 stop:569 length:237 start_codon:yes stop_codon:yes gene_type:complete